MPQPRAQAQGLAEIVRSLPILLGALSVVVLAVDVLLAIQPTWLDDLSHRYRSAMSLRPVLAPATNVVAAALAIALVVISSAVLLGFSRASATAPQLSLTPVWVALCMLSAARLSGPFPLPLPLPLFASLSGLLFVGGGTALRSGTRLGGILGGMSVAAPLVLLCAGYASSNAFSFGREAYLLVAALAASAVVSAALAFLRPRAHPGREIPGLEGINVVDELFSQVERAERSEARAAELERQLSAYTKPQPTPARAAGRGAR